MKKDIYNYIKYDNHFSYTIFYKLNYFYNCKENWMLRGKNGVTLDDMNFKRDRV